MLYHNSLEGLAYCVTEPAHSTLPGAQGTITGLGDRQVNSPRQTLTFESRQFLYDQPSCDPEEPFPGQQLFHACVLFEVLSTGRLEYVQFPVPSAHSQDRSESTHTDVSGS